jgi:hypothetical protein
MQCEKIAFEKHGGPEGIEEHRRGLLELRQERRALKRVTDQEKAGYLAIETLNPRKMESLAPHPCFPRFSFIQSGCCA